MVAYLANCTVWLGYPIQIWDLSTGAAISDLLFILGSGYFDLLVSQILSQYFDLIIKRKSRLID